MSATTTPQSKPPTPDADQALVAAYQNGDQRAAARLIERHSAALTRYLYSSGADGEEVDDLVQETLFRAFHRIATWRGEASFRSWLFTIGGNLLRDHFRSRKGRRVISLDNYDIPDRSDPHSDLAALEVEDRIREGLTRLPRLQREVFLLRTQEGTDYEEIAISLGTTPGAARVHYHHAVKRLKELLG